MLQPPADRKQTVISVQIEPEFIAQDNKILFLLLINLIFFSVFGGRPCCGPFSPDLAPSGAQAAGCRGAGQRVDRVTETPCA